MMPKMATKFRIALCVAALLLAAAGSQAFWGGKSYEEAVQASKAAMEDERYPIAQNNFERALKKSETVDQGVEAAVLLA